MHGTANITDTTFTGNTSDAGSTTLSAWGEAHLTNCTVDSGASSGTALFLGGDPGITLTHVTLSANSTDPALLTDGVVRFENTLIVNSAGDSCSLSGTPAYDGNNLENGNTCGFDMPNASANLGTLANNGGFTQTMALGASSDAIDAVDEADCSPGTDQRGLPRPVDGNADGNAHCDVGAYEYDGFVYIASGMFCMGKPDGSTECMGMTDPADENGTERETPQHEVTLTNAFYMQEHEVTQAEWQELAEWWNAESGSGVSMGTNPSYYSTTAQGADCGDNCPVERINFWDAVFYANAMSVRAGLEECYVCSSGWTGTPGGGCDYGDEYCNSGDLCTGGFSFVGYECEGYRLSTEAEWEYAYRAGSRTVYYPSDGNDGTYLESNLTQISWYPGNADSTTHPVSPLNGDDGKEPNAWGLYDMSGNVWEWVWDLLDTEYYQSSPSADPLGGDGTRRIYRGGGWMSIAWIQRATTRYSNLPDYRHYAVGFRLVRSVQ